MKSGVFSFMFLKKITSLTIILFLSLNSQFFTLAEDEKEIPSSADLKRTERFFLSVGETNGVSFERWDSEKKRFLFQKDDRHFAFETAQFLSWGKPAEFSAAESSLVLADGGIWSGNPAGFQIEKLTLDNHEKKAEEIIIREILKWENPFCGTLSFSLDEIGGILFWGTTISEREKLFHEIQVEKRVEDVLVFRTGERLYGEFLSFSRESEKVCFQTRDLSDPSLETFSPITQRLEISPNRLAAILLSTEMRLETDSRSRKIGQYFWIGLSDGSLFRMNPDENEPYPEKIPHDSIVYLESPLESQKFFDTSLTSATAQIKELRWLDEISPQVKFMKELRETEQGKQRTWNPRAAISGERFRLLGEIHRHGIGTITGTSLSWRLDGNFKTFGTIPACEKLFSSKIRFRIWLDGKLAAEKTITPLTKPELILVDVKGVEELRLEADCLNQPQSLSLKYPVHWIDAFLAP